MAEILKVPVDAAGVLWDTRRVEMAVRRTMRATVVGAMAVLAAFSLSGCGSNPVEDAVQNAVDNGAEKAAEKALENAASDGSNGDVSVDIGKDVEVPDSFPSGFPLPEGTLVAAVSVDEGIQLNYEIDGPSAAEDLAAHFAADPAFEETMISNMGGLQNWTYMSDEYSVMIGVVPDGESSQMTYLVVPQAG
ncbi:MAG: hypothetical protein CVT68_10790 [Actinobacteria bacterium HGW-Actinobacteria-8]|nr:MAG: hypothetical protein CVT68_10790 [Actinobacteria bacterium HGW-Actinobacteria-8]